jgi:stress-induced morphogen
MITEEYISQKCVEVLAATVVQCVLEGGGCEGGAKVQLTVVSDNFDGKPLLKRHRMVNDLFAEELSNNKIHAITIKAWTQNQYDSKK